MTDKAAHFIMRNIEEQRRTYTFPDGSTFVINNVTGFADSTTTHRLRDRDGALYIVPKGFVGIKVEGPQEFVL